MNIVISVSFIALAILLVHWYIDARRGLIPLQNSVGIKTRATMASEETWFAIHRKYAYLFLGDAMFFAVAGLTAAVFAIIDRTLNGMSNIALLAEIGIFTVMIIFTIIIGAVANQEAERLNEERYRAGK